MKNTQVLFQLINHQDGTRTVAVQSSMEDIAKTLSEINFENEEHDHFNDHVLILADLVDGGFAPSVFPILTIENFIAFINHENKDARHG